MKNRQKKNDIKSPIKVTLKQPNNTNPKENMSGNEKIEQNILNQKEKEPKLSNSPKETTSTSSSSLTEVVKGKITTSNSLELINFINELPVNKIATLPQEDSFLANVFVKFTQLEERSKIIETLLTRILIYENSKIQKNEQTPFIKFSKEHLEVNILQAETLFAKSQNILEIIKQDLQNSKINDAAVKAKDAVKTIEFAYGIYQKLLDTKYGQENLFITKIKDTQSLLTITIKTIPLLETQFSLFELALTERKKNLPDNKEYLVNLLTDMGLYGVTSDSSNIKVLALKYSQEAYNIIYSSELNGASAKDLCSVLLSMSDLYTAFGDIKKGLLITKQIDYIKQKFQLVKKPEISKETDSVKFIPIIKCGQIDESILTVKQKIQTNVLDCISEQSANGKWFNYHIYRELGVSGYVEKTNLKSQLGNLNNEANYKIALALCFEAINIGIMDSDIKNPICAVIFLQKYPEILKDILENHPEYFIDGYILQTSVFDAHTISEALTGQTLEKNIGYNKYFEKGVITAISNYKHSEFAISLTLSQVYNVKDHILKPIEDIIKKGDWSEIISNKLLDLIGNEHICKVLGKNLTQIEDVYSIVRLMAFDKIANVINEAKSTNFSFVSIIMEKYPALADRISNDHSYSLTNEHIKKLVEEKLPKLDEKTIAPPGDIQNTNENANQEDEKDVVGNNQTGEGEGN